LVLIYKKWHLIADFERIPTAQQINRNFNSKTNLQAIFASAKHKQWLPPVISFLSAAAKLANRKRCFQMKNRRRALIYAQNMRVKVLHNYLHLQTLVEG
jgi:hypothetical protein